MLFLIEAGVNGRVLWLRALLVKQTLLWETVQVSLLCLRLQQVHTCFSTGPGFWGFASASAPVVLPPGLSREAGLMRA